MNDSHSLMQQFRLLLVASHPVLGVCEQLVWLYETGANWQRGGMAVCRALYPVELGWVQHTATWTSAGRV